jgi:hypothetical protein
VAKYGYLCTALTGGTSGCLDKIDGDNLADQDVALVVVQSEQRFYIFSLDADLASPESSPDIIMPDNNAGDKRWLLLSAISVEVLPIAISRLETSDFLIGWTQSKSYEMLSITYSSNGVVSEATVKWPDGSSGTFTTTTENSIWYSIDAYTITHVNSGLTVTQTEITRDDNGNITTKPELTVA